MGKKIFVMVDMEGISGVFCRAQVASAEGHPLYHAARKYLTWDVNACVEGCIRGGASKVVVRDAHGGGCHFIWEELDPRAEYLRGHSGKERMPGIGTFDGLILLGYHAMAGTPAAVLEHTMSSKAWQNFWLNGVAVGEVSIDAGLAGDQGTPTIMVSGDDKVCREARRFLKGVVPVQVKQALDLEGAILLSKEQAHRRITAGAKKAVETCAAIRPYTVKAPVKMRLELVSRGRVPAGRAHVRVIDGRTFEVSARTFTEAWRRLHG
ncbi:MAG: M55 family metallopeptidase [Kiritimatiellae bacterium]|nr:M55 family metallopeptidase [Kiritimatiellia bacterium]